MRLDRSIRSSARAESVDKELCYVVVSSEMNVEVASVEMKAKAGTDAEDLGEIGGPGWLAVGSEAHHLAFAGVLFEAEILRYA
ncbi:MAG: hypothetical protein CME06_16425 [Gemmatimonadetes bacterium]|nr:hypothetical protein [Gemmatimonadota bacterium]